MAGILSNFCADIAKAYFIAAFITPILNSSTSWLEIIFVLIRGLIAVTILIIMSWRFAKLEGEQ